MVMMVRQIYEPYYMSQILHLSYLVYSLSFERNSVFVTRFASLSHHSFSLNLHLSRGMGLDLDVELEEAKLHPMAVQQPLKNVMLAGATGS